VEVACGQKFLIFSFGFKFQTLNFKFMESPIAMMLQRIPPLRCAPVGMTHPASTGQASQGAKLKTKNSKL
jgi:hypothetical protein